MKRLVDRIAAALTAAAYAEEGEASAARAIAEEGERERARPQARRQDAPRGAGGRG